MANNCIESWVISTLNLQVRVMTSFVTGEGGGCVRVKGYAAQSKYYKALLATLPHTAK